MVKKKKPIKITDLMDKRVDKLKKDDELICNFCEKSYKFGDGYDAEFCCDDCVEKQEDENELAGRI